MARPHGLVGFGVVVVGGGLVVRWLARTAWVGFGVVVVGGGLVVRWLARTAWVGFGVVVVGGGLVVPWLTRTACVRWADLLGLQIVGDGVAFLGRVHLVSEVVAHVDLVVLIEPPGLRNPGLLVGTWIIGPNRSGGTRCVGGAHGADRADDPGGPELAQGVELVGFLLVLRVVGLFRLVGFLLVLRLVGLFRLVVCEVGQIVGGLE